MKDAQFDRLARKTVGRSRRVIVRVAIGSFVGGALGMAGWSETDAAQVKRNSGEVCRKNGDCYSNYCSSKDSRGRQYCLCKSANDCPTLRNSQCFAATCGPSGLCGTTIDVGSDCVSEDGCIVNAICNEAGQCLGEPRVCPDEIENGFSYCFEGECKTLCDYGFGGANCEGTLSITFEPTQVETHCNILLTLTGYLPDTAYIGTWAAEDDNSGNLPTVTTDSNGNYGPALIFSYTQIIVQVTVDGVSSGPLQVSCPT